MLEPGLNGGGAKNKEARGTSEPGRGGGEGWVSRDAVCCETKIRVKTPGHLRGEEREEVFQVEQRSKDILQDEKAFQSRCAMSRKGSAW